VGLCWLLHSGSERLLGKVGFWCKFVLRGGMDMVLLILDLELDSLSLRGRFLRWIAVKMKNLILL
jgi:hypothetical protein